MRSDKSHFWYFSFRKMSSKLDKIHVSSIAFYLIFPLVLVIGSIFDIDTITSHQKEWMYAGSAALVAWLIFDFFYPALPVARSYILLHHLIAALTIIFALMHELYLPLAIGIILQEGYTFVFRKVLYAPNIELSTDLLRFAISGGLLVAYFQAAHWSIILLWIFFIVNNIYFFRSTHNKAFALEADLA